MNHLANGAADQSKTWENGVAQESRLACSAQNAQPVLLGLSVQVIAGVGLRNELC